MNSGILIGWHIRGTLKNPEQLLLLVVIPMAATLAVLFTPLGGSRVTFPALITLAIVAASFTSPAITWAFEREQGTWTVIASAPVSRLTWWSSLLVSVLVNVCVSVLALFATYVVARPFSTASESTHASLGIVSLAVVIFAVLATATMGVAWASALASRMRATAVLAIANAVFVVAILFGGLLIPASDLPWGGLLQWLPTGSAADLMTVAWESGTVDLRAAVVLLAWTIPGAALGLRLWRWR